MGGGCKVAAALQPTPPAPPPTPYPPNSYVAPTYYLLVASTSYLLRSTSYALPPTWHFAKHLQSTYLVLRQVLDRGDVEAMEPPHVGAQPALAPFLDNVRHARRSRNRHQRQ